MAWYLRKAFSTGPVRFNLSKSGLGFSLGVKGARWGMGPRGAYTHFGRHGLYYRSSYSGVSMLRTEAHERQASAMSAIVNDVLFKEPQIKTKYLTMNIEFKRKQTREIIYTLLSLVAIISGAYFLDKRNTIAAYTFVAIGCFFMLLIFYRFIRHAMLRLKSDRLFNEMRACCGTRDDGVIVNFDAIVTLINKYHKRLEESYIKRAFYQFYKDYLERLIFDVKISETEEKDIQRMGEILNLDKDLMHKIKLWIFNKAYLKVIEDKFFSNEEESDIYRIKNILTLSDSEISDEIQTLNTLKEARKIQDGQIDSINVDFQLSKDELCYHKTTGRMVKDKTFYSYQSGGVKHNVRGLTIEKEGELYLTSKRIVIVGDGVYSIKLEKIFNIESDIDDNLVSLDIEGRKNSLRITTPDTLIFSAKLNKLINTT